MQGATVHVDLGGDAVAGGNLATFNRAVAHLQDLKRRHGCNLDQVVVVCRAVLVSNLCVVMHDSQHVAVCVA
jgi:hypothetical protein